jgi:hypothetical protein
VQTVDFFTPIVDDPYVFGQIAAANALSDVYAMGGEPRTALAIAALPKDGPGADVVKAIFLGGHDKLREAGVVLLGGHTVTDTEIKFGYAITGDALGKSTAVSPWNSDGCGGDSDGYKTTRTYRADVRPFLPVDVDTTSPTYGSLPGTGTISVRLADHGDHDDTPNVLGATLVITPAVHYFLAGRTAELRTQN